MTDPKYLPPDEAKDLIAGIILDFAEQGADELMQYIQHTGFDITAIQSTDELLHALLGHYRIGQGTYDTDRALMDLCTWPPIAAEIFRRQQEARSLAK